MHEFSSEWSAARAVHGSPRNRHHRPVYRGPAALVGGGKQRQRQRQRQRRGVRSSSSSGGSAFFLEFHQCKSCCRIHAFHVKGEVGQQSVRRRQRGDRCELLWRFSCGLHCPGRAHEDGRNQQSEETVARETFFSCLSVLFCFSVSRFFASQPHGFTGWQWHRRRRRQSDC